MKKPFPAGDDLPLDAILEEDNYSWIKVRRYVDIGGFSDEKLARLEVHHEKETTFLIGMCRRLAQALKEKK